MPRPSDLVLAGSLGLLAWHQVGYGAALALLVRKREDWSPVPEDGLEPVVSLIIAAHREEEAIAAKVADARAQDWPREQASR